MATITTTGTGNWNSTTPNAPWPSGVIPAATDDIIIGDGFTLTVPNGYTAKCGADGTIALTDYAIRTVGDNGTGVLVIEAGGVLEVARHMRQGNVTWTINGAVRAANTVQRLHWQIGTRSSAPWGRLVVEGRTKGDRALIGKTAGGVGWFYLGGPTGYTGRGQMTTRWAKFEHIGEVTSAGAFNVSSVVTGFHNIHENTWWDYCGEVDYRNLAEDSQLTIDGCAYTNPVQTTGRSLVITTSVNVASSSVVRKFVNSALIGDVRHFPLVAGVAMGFETKNLAIFSATGTPISMMVGQDAAGSGTQKIIEDILTYQESNGGFRNGIGNTESGVVSRLIGVRQCATDSASEDTFHFAASGDLDVEDSWVEVHPGWNTTTGTGSATNGGDDAFVANNSAVVCDFTVRRCISATNRMGRGSGTILTVGGASSWQAGKRFFVERCTMPNGGAFSAEHGTPVLGVGDTPMATISDSLLTNPTPTASQFFANNATWSALPDGIIAASGNATHNVSGTPYAGPAGNPIAASKYSPSGYPTNAVEDNPYYVDPSRDFLGFGRAMLGNPSLKDRRPIFFEFVKRYTDDAWNSAFTIAHCLAWMSAGYAPRNPRMVNKGAVPVNNLARLRAKTLS